MIGGDRERVVVAMSGGVDSSVAAALLLESGCEVVGVTMQLAGDASRCCSLADAEDARRVAERLGVRFYVANYAERFAREVIEDFADAYLRGRTPIPCITCNKRFKFDYLMERAGVFGADAVATGHYARIDRDPESGRFQLRRAVDLAKDQSYFLFQLDQHDLARIRFPLGGLDKPAVRARARALGLATADKPESQELCFVAGTDYAKLVEEIRPQARESSGEIVDEEGRLLGRHAGVHHFTVGQRHGLGISSDQRLYVTRIEAGRQRVVVGGREALARRVALLSGVSWVAGEAPRTSVRARVQVRHRHAGVTGRIEPGPEATARVVFDEPVFAVSPGQAAVFYEEVGPEQRLEIQRRGEQVLGGGWIEAAPD